MAHRQASRLRRARAAQSGVGEDPGQTRRQEGEMSSERRGLQRVALKPKHQRWEGSGGEGARPPEKGGPWSEETGRTDGEADGPPHGDCGLVFL